VWRHVLHMLPSTGCRGAFAQAVAAGPKRNLGPLWARFAVLYDRNLQLGPMCFARLGSEPSFFLVGGGQGAGAVQLFAIRY
jgi:hypothetical protein